MRRIKNHKGITLISLIITIIILVILSGVVLNLILGDNGIIGKANEAKEATKKQTAIDIMNFKIADIEISSYDENGDFPTLQYLADKLCEDNDIEYIVTESKKYANLNKIDVTDATSIFTKLKNYPYEFEINGSLEIINISENKVANDVIANWFHIVGLNFDDYSALDSILTDENTCETLMSSEDALNYMISYCELLLPHVLDSITAKNALYNHADIAEAILANSPEALTIMKTNSKCKLVSISGRASYNNTKKVLYNNKSFVFSFSCNGFTGSGAGTIYHGNYIVRDTFIGVSPTTCYGTTGSQITINKFASSVQAYRSEYTDRTFNYYAVILPINE